MDSAGAVSMFTKVEGLLRLLTVLNLTAYEWPNPACVQDGAKFDFIVIGGGTAGCLITNRLLEAGNVNVLLIEAGGYPPMESDIPGLFPFLKNSQYEWNLTSTSDGIATETQKKKVLHMTQGKMLGGSGSLGYMAYGRGYPQDYNHWAAITNDSSWSWESVLPIFQKNDKLVDNILLEELCSHTYGTKGNISFQKQYYQRNIKYFEALQELGYDYHLNIDEHHPLGFSNVMFNIDNNIRQSTALKCLSPIKNNKKLYVMLNSLATKIIIDENKTAVGVKVLTKDRRVITVKAKKEVIVTAGTIKSPHLLMLSGIGPKHHLKKFNIKVEADLPVGKNFQDHVNSMLLYKMTKSDHAGKVEDPHKYPYAVFDGFIALNKSQGYPDYNTICVHFGDIPSFLGLCAFFFSYDNAFCDTLVKGLDGKEAFLVFITHLNPKSRGQILLVSANPEDKPKIVSGHYTNRIDIENHGNYLADYNRILNTTFFRRMNAELVSPHIKACVGLKEGTKDYWRCHAMGTSAPSYYFVGTCAMGSVLDTRLRVHGIKRLRVADASVMPTNIRRYTANTVVMVAQKASDMIIEDNRL